MLVTTRRGGRAVVFVRSSFVVLLFITFELLRKPLNVKVKPCPLQALRTAIRVAISVFDSCSFWFDGRSFDAHPFVFFDEST